MRSSSFIVVSTAVVLLTACSDEGETDPGTAAHASAAAGDTTSPASTGPGGQGGDGGAPGQGGAGGEGGSGGAGGGGGGAPGACLDASTHEGLFAIDVPELCAVAVYDAPALATEQYGALPTWGRHGGLLIGTFPAAGGAIASIDLLRFTAPDGANGELEVVTTTVDLGLDGELFAGAQVVDLPGSDRSAFTYTGSDFMNEGGLVVLDGGGVVADRALIGGLGVAAVPTGDAARVLVTALGPVGGAAATPGFYAADGCEAPAELCDDGAIATWGDATGPVTVDADGNAFAIMTSFDGTQEARGWTADVVQGDAEPSAGATVLDLPGFGSPLAAVAPAGDAPGLLVFQPADATTFAPVEPVVVRYAVAGGAIAPEGEPVRLLDLEDDEAPVSLTADDDGRLWVGVPSGGGTRFVVLGRAP